MIERDPVQMVDDNPISRMQMAVFFLMSLVFLLDGFDFTMMGNIAPSVRADFGLSGQQLATVLSGSLFGTLIGSLVLSPLGDRLGRRPLIIASTLIFGVGSLAGAFAPTATALTLTRVVTGIGCGGALSNAMVLVAELAPQRNRRTIVAAVALWFMLGAVLCALATSALLEAHGWQSVLLVGGGLPLLLAVALQFFLPESLAYASRTPRMQDRAQILAVKIEPALAGSAFRMRMPEHAAEGSPVRALLSEGRAPITLCLWAMSFMTIMCLNLLTNWMPTVAHDSGVPADKAPLVNALFQGGAIVAALLSGIIMDRYPPARWLMILGIIALLSGIGLWASGGAWTPLLIAATVAGFGVVGLQSSLNVVAATLVYPTRMRSAGVGWALGIGRFGAILGPFIGATLLATMKDPSFVLGFVALPMLLVVLLSHYLANRLKGFRSAA